MWWTGIWRNGKFSESILWAPWILQLGSCNFYYLLWESPTRVLHSLSPPPSKGQWAPIPAGFNLEIYVSDSAVKGFLAWLRSETNIIAWRTHQSSVCFGVNNVYEILNLMRFHMQVKCVRFSWEAGWSYNMTMATFPFDSIWLALSRQAFPSLQSPSTPLDTFRSPSWFFGFRSPMPDLKVWGWKWSLEFFCVRGHSYTGLPESGPWINALSFLPDRWPLDHQGRSVAAGKVEAPWSLCTPLLPSAGLDLRGVCAEIVVTILGTYPSPGVVWLLQWFALLIRSLY